MIGVEFKISHGTDVLPVLNVTNDNARFVLGGELIKGLGVFSGGHIDDSRPGFQAHAGDVGVVAFHGHKKAGGAQFADDGQEA